MSTPRTWTPGGRDRALGRLRVLTWALVLGSAGLAAGLSAVAAHAFKGHDAAGHAVVARRPAPRVVVPGPQDVPGIAGQPAPLQPPAIPPATPAPQPQPQPAAPPVSGGS